ncbi:MAG: hypothetical protein M1825_005155 [Sarcosagium campestre]|nr:MAG: hypothetical protein M1825_005155 [Sarcosagium campestre]
MAIFSHELQLPVSFVVTAMLMIPLMKTIVLGSRSGALCFFDSAEALEDISSASHDATNCFRRIHGQDAITSIIVAPSTANDATRHYILTTGRSGVFAVHKLQKVHQRHSPVDLVTVDLSYPLFAPLIEGASYGPSGELTLYGFRSTRFVAWNENIQKEVMNIECGGAHRSWDYLHESGGAWSGPFVWSKSGHVHIGKGYTASHRVLQSGGHGREIKAVAASPCRSRGLGAPDQIIATGAEDTCIRLFTESASDRKRCFSCVKILKKHTTGIQQLQWSKCGTLLFSSGGFDEFYAWQIQSIPSIGLGSVCAAVRPVENDVSDLRITSFDIVDDWTDAPTDKVSRGSLIVSMVLSDSTVLIYRYSIALTKFELLVRGLYTTRCLTQAAHYISDAPILLTASTDGYIGLWDIAKSIPLLNRAGSQISPQPNPGAICCQARTRVHQSAVKCMVIASLGPQVAVVATGGDDNALAFTLLRSDDNGVARPSWSTLLIPNAHAAAVTAIQQLTGLEASQTPEQPVRLLFATAGNDQRLKVWRFVFNPDIFGVEALQLELLRNEYTCIADVSSMALIQGQDDVEKIRLIICGVGMDVWSMG